MHYLELSRKFTRSVTYIFLAIFISVFGPAPAMMVSADEPDCTPVEAAPTGTPQPTGADSVTYKYNPCTGLWENEHYTWSPATKLRTATDSAPYTYNDSTGQWDSYNWTWSPGTSSWVKVAFSVSDPPAGAEKIGGPAPVVNSVADPGPDSTNSTDTNSTNTADINSSTSAEITNYIGSLALSGNASILMNTNAGSALSGNALAIANVLNMIQSSSALGPNTATFVANIEGDVQGDLLIDPSYLQPASGDNSINSLTDIDINLDNDGVIANNIDLTAKTGDATVSQNTNAGSATSGNAQAVANVVNLLNSMIAAQQSFLGVVNINGNFNGDILMPQNFLDTLIASNAPHENVTISTDTLNEINANLSNNQSIDNNISSKAQSGAASVYDNTNAGSATSGNAKTNVTIFNLTNQDISATNTMLVFVNVLGKWVGLIMNAPEGSTAAAFGGGVTNASAKNNLDLNIDNNGSITNNIDTEATSGDATVSMNKTGGSAKSGDAETAINLANVSNFSTNLSGWFGILFINVFGNWFGNFGVAQPQANTPNGSNNNGAIAGAGAQAFAFIPTPKVTSSANQGSVDSTNDLTSYIDSQMDHVAAAVMGDTTGPIGPSQKGAQAVDEGIMGARFVGAALILAGLTVFGINFFQNRRELILRRAQV